jgi:phytoene dehydrogenase-like protein
MSTRYDAVIIGGGHNGLTTAAYLAKAGLKTLVLERRDQVGGTCVTEEKVPGFKMSTTSYVNSLFQPQIIRDLELKKHGYRVFRRGASHFVPLPDGGHFMSTGDEAHDLEQVRKFSRRDASALVEFEGLMAKMAVFVEPLMMMTPPDPGSNRLRDLLGLLRLGLRTRSQLGREGLYDEVALMTCSAKDYLDKWFESDVVKASFAINGIIGAYAGVMSPGTAYVLFHHMMGEVDGVKGAWGYQEGGMGGVTQALARAAQSYGAEIRTRAGVARIRERDGRTDGVVLESGEEIDARVVASNADPKRTFLSLLNPERLPGDFVRGIRNIRTEGVCLKVNLALAELPNFKSLPGTQTGPQHMGSIMTAHSIEFLEKAWDDCKYGRPSEHPFIEMVIPSTHDPSVAPPGKHVASCFVQYAPYTLKNGYTWDQIKDRFADRVIDDLAVYAPNLKGAILGRHVYTPLDLEREFGMTGGHIFHGEMSPDALFFMRPVPGWARYRTPIRNLYLCGSGAHPGGGVMGACGYNAAREILRDRRFGAAH